MTQVTGPGCGCGGGQTRSFTWDNFLREASETDGDGATHKITYTYGRDVRSADLNNVLRYVDVAYPSATAKTEPLASGVNRVTNWSYYAVGDVRHDLAQVETTPSADKPGSTKTTTLNYSTLGLLTSRVEQGYINGTSTSYTTSFTYDTNNRGRILTISGPRTDLTQTTTYAYYPDTDTDLARRGQLQTITDPVGNITTYAASTQAAPYNTYDLFGNARSVTDPNGVVTQRDYDGRGRLILSRIKGVTGDPTDLVMTYAFDAAGRLTKTTLPLLNGTSNVYDTAGRLTDVIRFDPAGNQQERMHYTLDSMGQKSEEDAQSCSTPANPCLVANWLTQRKENFQYDGYGRLSEVDHPTPVGAKILYTYDAAGNLQTVQDENHASPNTTYAYDYANRLTSVTQTLAGAPGSGGSCPAAAGNVATCYSYDVQDNLAAVGDPNGNQTTYNFDDFRRMRQQVSPVTSTTSYSYDQAGNLTGSTDARNVVTARAYDAANRVTSSVSSGPGVVAETVTWTYDDPMSLKFRKGRLSTMTDPSGSATYTYERRGLLATDAKTIGGVAFNTSYTFDGNGNRKTIAYPSNRAVSYTFDFADRPNALTQTSPSAKTYVLSTAYWPFGPEKTLNLNSPQTMTWTRSYNQRYQPTENKLANGGGTIFDNFYTEDAAGNITGICGTTPCPGTLAAYDRTFGYDDLNRLTTANSGTTGSPALWGTGSYTYDLMGNMTGATLGSTTRTFAYVGTTPKLSSVTENFAARVVTYDAVGNELAVAGAPTAYSARNLVGGADGLGYTYDGRGLRTTTRSYTLQGGPGDPVSPGVDTTPNGSATPPAVLGDGSLEPGETAYVAPTWKNTGSSSLSFSGTASGFSGVGGSFGLTYTIPDSTASYGPIAAGASGNCGPPSGNCYQLAVGGTRTQAHVDAQFTEAGNSSSVVWTLHIGNSFTDVHAGDTFYNAVETILHNGLTVGCAPNYTQYCVNNTLLRGETAIFLAKAALNLNVPAAGPGYNCNNMGSATLVNDVHGGDVWCPHVNYLASINALDYCDQSNDYCPSGSAPPWDYERRGQMAIIVSRALVKPLGDAGVPDNFTGTGAFSGRHYDCTNGPAPFTDVPLNSPPGTNPSCKNIGYIWALGIVNGFGDGTYHPNDTLLRGQMAVYLVNGFGLTISGLPAAGPAAGAFARDFVYSPEMNLLEESTISTFGGNPSPSGGYDYLWFNGHPIAEENGGTHWTFTDHLGTPILQTDGSGTVFWRPEYEPYGRVWALRTTDQHEGPRFPGQEAEELNISGDGNGSSERSYNIFRWYRAKWGRYTQADPVGVAAGPHVFAYGIENPINVIDPLGLLVQVYCTAVGQYPGAAWSNRKAGEAGAKHCYVRVRCDCDPPGPYDLRLEVTGPAGTSGRATIPDPPGFAYGGGSIVPISPTDNDPRNCARAECVRKKYQLLQGTGYSYPMPLGLPLGPRFGPNSNTFANDLLRSCGFKADWPNGVLPLTPIN